MLMVSIDSAAGVGYVAQMSVGNRLQNNVLFFAKTHYQYSMQLF